MKNSVSSKKSSHRIAAIVITYNRKKLLAECLKALLNQSRALDKIYIIDNASTDGTREFLEELGILSNDIIQWYELGENLGSSGGFHYGVKKGYEDGYDWVWVMDDDALPEIDSLEILSSSVISDACMYSAYVVPGTKDFSEPINLKFPGQDFKTYWSISEDIEGAVVEGAGAPPLGLLIPRAIVAAVGLPREDVFIFGEYEYLDRIRNAGFKVFYNMKSVIRHPGHTYRFVKIPIKLKNIGKGSIWTKYPLLSDKIWKEYYGVRNETNFIIRSNNLGFKSKGRRIVMLLFDVSLKIFYGNQKRKRTIYLAKALTDGILGRMGRRVNPF